MADAPRYALQDLFGPGRPEFTEHIPHCKRIGMQVVHTGPREATVRLPWRDELVGDPQRGVVFGGVITTLLDHASGLAAACSLEELKPIATLDLRINYLRAAKPKHDLTGRVECYKVTRHVAFVRGAAWDESPDDPFATVVATMMIGAHDQPSPMMRRALGVE
jgi:uncharacterized protein (TIGR00369 family)